MKQVYDDGAVELWHSDSNHFPIPKNPHVVVTDPPIGSGYPPRGMIGAHLIVHPHFINDYPPPVHVSAWIRHTPGLVRNGFGHHWNAVLHYGPADLETDVFWDDEPRETEHPAERGVRPMTELLAALPAGVILDPFCGTGSTLLAARALGRRAIGIELDQRWVEVACQRLSRSS